MAVIKINNFGGEVPSLSARALPADKARISYNLYPGVDEFRPLLENKDVATVGSSNPLSLFRLDRKPDGTLNDDHATGWLTYAGLRSFAKGQINDDLTGRTYYSFDDGSAPPRVMDAGVNPARDGLAASAAVDKPLGVPAPNAPKVELLVGDELTPDEYAGVMQIKTAEITQAVRANAAFSLIGTVAVGDSTPGYLATVVSGVVAPALVPGGGTSGGGVVVVGGGGGVIPPAAPTVVVLPEGAYFYNPYLGHTYTPAGGVMQILQSGYIYSADGHTYAINSATNKMEMLT